MHGWQIVYLKLLTFGLLHSAFTNNGSSLLQFTSRSHKLHVCAPNICHVTNYRRNFYQLHSVIKIKLFIEIALTPIYCKERLCNL